MFLLQQKQDSCYNVKDLLLVNKIKVIKKILPKGATGTGAKDCKDARARGLPLTRRICCCCWAQLKDTMVAKKMIPNLDAMAGRQSQLTNFSSNQHGSRHR